MELIDLIGKHIFSGLDTSTEKIERWSGYPEDCDVFRFVLDGVTYSVVEDPEDGYRSSLKELVISDQPVLNRFPGIEVTGVYRNKSKYVGDCDILELYDASNGKLILEIGTDMTDDYYPSCVMNYSPENMSINEGK